MNDPDIMRDVGYLALASRLKRLADLLLADAAKVHAESGEPVQPGQFPLIAALDRYGPMTINDAAQVLGISQTRRPARSPRPPKSDWWTPPPPKTTSAFAGSR